MSLDAETKRKLESINRKLSIITNAPSRKTEDILISLRDDLAFIIGKLSSIYEVLAKNLKPKETD